MRITPPGTLKIDRATLLAAIRQRLEQNDALNGTRLGEPTDPGWVLMEQVAWMVETLSLKLDDYPQALVQQVLYVLGAKSDPALPAVGVVVALPKEAGSLSRFGAAGPWVTSSGEEKDPCVFYAPQTEQRSHMAFVPLERRVELVKPSPKATINWYEFRDGELFSAASEQQNGVRALYDFAPGKYTFSEAFDGQAMRIRMDSPEPDRYQRDLEAACEEVGKRYGWLSLTVKREEQGVCLEARVDPTQAGWAYVNYEWRGAWRPLGSWAPRMRLRPDPKIPASREAEQAHAGDQLIVRGLPPTLKPEELAGLLAPEPIPFDGDQWRTLWEEITQQDQNLRHSSAKGSTVPSPNTIDWLPGALREGRYAKWADATVNEASRLIEIRFEPAADRHEPRRIRLALAVEEETAARQIEMKGLVAFPIMPLVGTETETYLDAESTSHAEWHVKVPSTSAGARNTTLFAFDVEVSPKARGLLLIAPPTVSAVLLNAVLVINAPRVQDGVKIVSHNHLPLRVDLRHPGLVTPAVLEQVSSPGLASLLKSREFPLASFKRDDSPDGEVRDWEGIEVEARDGTMVLNSPDSRFRLEPGNTLTLDWYRRTDGRWGQLGPDTITLVEQAPGGEQALQLEAVTNPYPTVGGRDAEAPEATIQRLFGPQDVGPVLPSDFEQDLRRYLKRPDRDLMIRVWSYSERTLFPTKFWAELPLISAAPRRPDAARRERDETELEQRRVRDQGQDGGPDVLVIAIGPSEGVMEEDEFAQLRSQVQDWFKHLHRGFSFLSSPLVLRLRPVTLESDSVPPDFMTPAYGTWGLREAVTVHAREEHLRASTAFDDNTEGLFLVDARGERRRVYPGVLLLDAVVVGTRKRSSAPGRTDSSTPGRTDSSTQGRTDSSTQGQEETQS